MIREPAEKANEVHFVTARPDGIENNVAVGRILGKSMSVSTNRTLGHANDCAYYDDGYFIAQGGGNAKNNTKVKRLRSEEKILSLSFGYDPKPFCGKIKIYNI